MSYKSLTKEPPLIVIISEKIVSERLVNVSSAEAISGRPRN